jgi:FtsH-binding integral membrane protein
MVPLIVNTCSSDASHYWLPLLLAYKGVYLLVGLLLAFQTLNVHIKELRDSKVIVISVFATFVISVVLTVIGFFVDDDPNAFYALLGVFILSLVTSVMALLFFPRVCCKSYLDEQFVFMDYELVRPGHEVL